VIYGAVVALRRQNISVARRAHKSRGFRRNWYGMPPPDQKSHRTAD
jgi:hypothetical protein